MKNYFLLVLALVTNLAFAESNPQRISAQAPLTLTNGVMAIPAASSGTNGYLTAANWNTFNSKQAALTIGNISSPTSGVSITGGTGAIIGSGVTVAIQTASGSQPGLLSAVDWNTFNGKQNALTLGDLTSPTSGVSVTGGTGAVVGSGTAVSIQTASGSQPGLLSAADWSTFNGKQAAGSYITALTTDVVASGPGSAAATIQANVVTNAKLATMATASFKGRTTAGTGNVEDLTATQATALLNVFGPDSGSGGVKGLVPATTAGDATKYLKGDGTWATVSATGDVAGPASSVDNSLVAFDGTTGKSIKQPDSKLGFSTHTLDGASIVLRATNYNNANNGWEVGKAYWTLSGGTRTAQFLRGDANPDTDYVEFAADSTDLSGFKRLKWFFLGAMNWDYKQSLLNDLGFRSSIATVSGVHRFDTFIRGATSTRTGETDFNYNLDGSTDTLIASLKPNGEMVMRTVGKGVALTKGTGALAGIATLSSGTVTVTNANVDADSVITLGWKSVSGTPGTRLTYTVSNGVSFTINSDSASDASDVTYVITQTRNAL